MTALGVDSSVRWTEPQPTGWSPVPSDPMT